MDKKTLKYLEHICEITETIFNIYNSLYYLYINNPSSPHFKSMLEYLALTLEEEENYYQYFIKNPTLAGNATLYLLNISDKDLASVTFTALNQDETEIKQQRIITKLHLIALNDKNYFEENIEEDYKLIISGEKEGIDFFLNFYPKLETEISIRTSQFIDEEYSNDKFYQKIKFYMGFLEPDLEKIFLHNGFSKVRANFKERMPETVDEISNISLNAIYQLHGMDVLIYLLDELLDYTDEDFNIAEEAKIFYLILLEFRAALLFIDNEAISELNEFIENKINSEEYQDAHEYDELALNQIYETINNRHKDKELANQDIYGPFEL